jgi:hypothetical protein
MLNVSAANVGEPWLSAGGALKRLPWNENVNEGSTTSSSDTEIAQQRGNSSACVHDVVTVTAGRPTNVSLRQPSIALHTPVTCELTHQRRRNDGGLVGSAWCVIAAKASAAPRTMCATLFCRGLNRLATETVHAVGTQI